MIYSTPSISKNKHSNIFILWLLFSLFSVNLNIISVCYADNVQLKKDSKKPIDDSKEFNSFIIERKYLNESPIITASEAEQLLQFIEKVEISKTKPGYSNDQIKSETHNFIDYLRQGYGEFMKVGNGVYIVHSYFVDASKSGIFLADMNTHEFNLLARGYGLDISYEDIGILPDGTGWILASCGGLTNGIIESGFHLITYYDDQNKTKVYSTELAGEVRAYHEEPTTDKITNYCGSGENRLVGNAGNVSHPVWKNVGPDNQTELLVPITQINCDEDRPKLQKTNKTFTILKGKVIEKKS